MKISKNLIDFLESISVDTEWSFKKKEEIYEIISGWFDNDFGCVASNFTEKTKNLEQDISDLLKLIERVELVKIVLRHEIENVENEKRKWVAEGMLKLLEGKE